MGDKTKIIFAKWLEDEVRQLLKRSPARVDTEYGLRIYGPISGGLEHLVVVVVDDRAKLRTHPAMKSHSYKIPLPTELGVEGFLGPEVEFPLS